MFIDSMRDGVALWRMAMLPSMCILCRITWPSLTEGVEYAALRIYKYEPPDGGQNPRLSRPQGTQPQKVPLSPRTNHTPLRVYTTHTHGNTTQSCFKDISERLSDLYVDQGRVDEAANIPPVRIAVMRNTLEGWPSDNVSPQKTALTFLEERAPLRDLPNVASLLPTHHPNATGSRRKVGRNDPCPCGSGKKFKKCCCG
jgi:hypothetical protein